MSTTGRLLRSARAAIPTCALLAIGCGTTPDGTELELPGGAPGIGFDDLRFSPSLARLLVPGGRSGKLYLVDPDSLAVTSVSGMSRTSAFDGGHDFGPTSVDEGRGVLFVTDRTTESLLVVDPAMRSIVHSVALKASPDYVRFVASTNELWITEPDAEQIEVFALGSDVPPTPVSSATIAISNGPESLVIDEARGRAYTHRWQASTAVVDLASRSVVTDWQNGCAAARGLGLDSARGWFFAACLEGTLSVLDVTQNGRLLSSLSRGAGFDVIGYSEALHHVYAAGSACECLIVFSVSDSGELTFVERFAAPSETHCVAADDRGHAWVCDPDGGALYRIDDPSGRPKTAPAPP